MTHPIELLCPAKNLECGIEAIRHGADAIYIGGPTHGARAAAGNSLNDIQQLCDYAHIFGARVYVTVNTIIYEHELKEVEQMVWQLYEAGVDALIVQDMAFMKMHLPPIALHASTQVDTRTPEKAARLERQGFSQIVLARELSIEEIKAIRQRVSVPLEGFIHGALCVSYSGKCFVSEHICHRSANRGECAQFCRMAFDLVDARGEVQVKNKHLLSMKDMNRSANIEEMIDAGISSFKIEGRLKDVAYVKNITAFYRKKIDAVLARRPDLKRLSYGQSQILFEPQVAKSFNRGFTDFFLHGRKADIFSFDTPKAIGAPIGRVHRVMRQSFTTELDEGLTLSAGDGLCFKQADGTLVGFRVNKVVGGEVFPLSMPPLQRGTELFRNYDIEFDRILKRPTAIRKVAVTATLNETTSGFALTLTEEGGMSITQAFEAEKTEARSPQHENIVRQLSKTGDTPFVVTDVTVHTQGERFIPSSLLGEWRRTACEALLTKKLQNHLRDLRPATSDKVDFAGQTFDYSENVANSLAKAYYLDHGASNVMPAFEVQHERNAKLMTCRHCIRYALGYCPTYHKRKAPWQEPLRLRLPNGDTFPLHFDCKNCEMNVLPENS